MLPALNALTRSSRQIPPLPPCPHKASLNSFLRGTLPHTRTRDFVRTYASATAPPHKPTNEKIPHTHIRIVDPITSKLSPAPTPLTDLLASLDLKTQLVELVTSTPEPIVRVVDRKEAFARYKEQRKALKKGQKSGEAPKEIQLTWAVASGDLKHKLAKVRSNLEKGYKVDVVLAPKKGQVLPKPKEMEARAVEIAQALGDVGKEWKDREVGKTITIMSFQRLVTAS
ncbi:hypothetical protein HYDPIDRAFT_122644 [Hydnomerulius pinastri MD-312]|nr:hypothetical protein HYDPIDRAFT_122644 [Hydnomerulius pinastri MD-312]